MADEHAPAERRVGEHAGTKVYVGVAVVLAVITTIELMVFYVEALKPVLIPVLLVLSAAKFTLVVMFFMHLRYDSRVLTGIFLGPLLVAVGLIVAMLALYGVFTSAGGG